jgi:hypothetical protein
LAGLGGWGWREQSFAVAAVVCDQMKATDSENVSKVRGTSTLGSPPAPFELTTRHDTTRHDTTRHDTTRHDTTRHDTTRTSRCVRGRLSPMCLPATTSRWRPSNSSSRRRSSCPAGCVPHRPAPRVPKATARVNDVVPAAMAGWLVRLSSVHASPEGFGRGGGDIRRERCSVPTQCRPSSSAATAASSVRTTSSPPLPFPSLRSDLRLPALLYCPPPPQLSADPLCAVCCAPLSLSLCMVWAP